MKIGTVYLLVLGFLSVSCNVEKSYTVKEGENPPVKKNTAFKSHEDLTSPKFQALKEKYQLDTIFHGEQDEFKRQLMLRHWIRTVISISDFEPSYPGEGFPEKIIDAGLEGQGYHCGHYMIVQNALMNAYGYVTRCLGAGPGVKGGPDGHHGINEVWNNAFKKWYLSDAKYNHHFEKNGIPLSALEIREEYLKNKAADIVMVKGPDRTPIDADGVADARGQIIRKTRADFAQTYTWIEWEQQNDRYTHWPANSDALAVLNMYEDEYFRKNKWIWDDRPHWAYGTEFMRLVPDREAIEWTPNTISSKVDIDGGIARIQLESETPNLMSYQMKRSASEEWQEVPSRVEIEITRDNEEFTFRTINLAGVAGPEHTIVIAR